MVTRNYPSPNRLREGHRPSTSPPRPNQRDRKETRDQNAEVQLLWLGGHAIINGIADTTATPSDIGRITERALEIIQNNEFDPRRRL